MTPSVPSGSPSSSRSQPSVTSSTVAGPEPAPRRRDRVEPRREPVGQHARIRRGAGHAGEVARVVAVLHVRQGDVGERPQASWRAALLGNRPAKGLPQLGGRPLPDRRPIRQSLEVLDHAIDNPVPQGAHLRGLETERIGIAGGGPGAARSDGDRGLADQEEGTPLRRLSQRNLQRHDGGARIGYSAATRP